MAKCAKKDCKKRARRNSQYCGSHTKIATMPSMNNNRKCKSCKKTAMADSEYCIDHMHLGQKR